MLQRLAVLVTAAGLAVAVWLWQRPSGEPPVVAGVAEAAAVVRLPPEDPVAPPERLPLETDPDPIGALRLAGRVSDASGAPVAGAQVVLGSVPARSAVTDGDGGFAFAGLAGRTYALWARSGEQVGGPFQVRPAEGARLVIGAGAVLEIEITDTGGGPAPAGTVVQLHGGAELRDGATLEVEAPGGRARATGCAPGFLEVVATAPGRGPSREELVVAAGSGLIEIRMALAAPRSDREPAPVPGGAARVSGRVVGPGGTPVPWAGVRVLPVDPARRGPVRDVLADEQGRFAIDGLPVGALYLVARGEQAASEVMLVDPAAGPPSRTLTVPLSIAGAIDGRVVDDQGSPVAGAEVGAEPQLWGDSGAAGLLHGPPVARTGDQGQFALRSLPAGIWRLTARLPGSPVAARGRATTGDRDVELVLARRPR